MKKRKLCYYTDIRDLPHMPAEEKGNLHPVTEQFAFRANDYYLSLINWDDPADPIRRLIVPDMDELEE